MIPAAIGRLLKLGGPAMCALGAQDSLDDFAPVRSSAKEDLLAMLQVRNGFYVFDRALLIRPVSSAVVPLGLREWNEPKLWKDDYGGGLTDVLCFAEDVFGGQFAICGEKIVAIDPETGEKDEMAQTMDEWALSILRDHNVLTGHSLAAEWQRLHGELSPGFRLLPKSPFVTGGSFSIDNLYSLPDVEGMRFRGSIARQLRDVPDGGCVEFNVRGPQHQH